jgi:transposase
METFSFFIGIDISKATLDFAVVVTNKLLFHFQSTNDKKGIGSFMKQLKEQCSGADFTNSLYCMEHTGIYNNHLLNFLQAKQAKIWLEHPIHIKESLGMVRGKNDKVDAQRIATYAYKNRDEVRLWVPKRDIIQKLDRLTALRNRLVKARKMMQSPLTDCENFISKKDLNEAKKACQSTMQALDKDIKKVNQDIQNTIQSDTYLKELYEFIESVKGIGPAIATEIIIVTNEFKNINEPKKFACHAGVVPFNYSSGQYKGKAKTSNKANKQLKALLHNGAMSAIQHSPEIREYYLRKTAEGKNQMLVVNNVCNKLIHRVFSCVHRKEKYKDFYSPLVA